MLSIYREYLTPFPKDDPRPALYSTGVLLRVINAHVERLKGWLQYRIPELSHEIVVECAEIAITLGRGDAFLAALEMKNQLKWPSDAALCMIFFDMCAALPIALRDEQRDWIVRTGVRFPAEKGDMVEWVDESRGRFTGKVQEIDSKTAAAFIQPYLGQIASGAVRRVYAEALTQNKSRPVGDRQLGFRVEDTEETR